MFDEITSNFQVSVDLVIDKVKSWVDTFVSMLPNFVVATLVMLATALVAKLIRRFVYKVMRRITKNEAINRLTSTVAVMVVFAFGFFIALRILNLDKTVTSLLAGLGIVGLALGFAFKDIAANFIAGIYLAIKSPINMNDIIKYQDAHGAVKKIGLRATTVKTFQGQDVIIPNRLIVQEKYTHYSINGERRVDLDVGVSYGDDLEKVEEVALTAIKKLSNLKKVKPVDLYFKEFGDSAIVFTVRYWVIYSPHNFLEYLAALSQGIKNIKKAFDENDITITFPIRTIDFGIKGGKSLADIMAQNHDQQHTKTDSK
ncbi:Conserved TM helix [Saccharicrinis carchari]|uniref:Conserved TM helix n=1 Tax=Saccharicrinis carchari TaxID=1168039 RepID=A0A521BFQ2_SACCC|nr:mechanosensitive ion channel family protein [Saccharicrinis carchari]SMO45550.1 Conserved TM helix [Saccharicrinis carchari]